MATAASAVLLVPLLPVGRAVWDTSRHLTKCLCEGCDENHTGYFATQEVLDKYATDEITDAMQAEIVALCVSRGSMRKGGRDAA